MTHFLYLMGHVDRYSGLFAAPVKIGITKSPPGRLATIRTSAPFDVELLFTFAFQSKAEAEEIERRAHLRLEEFRESGEWFDTAPLEALSAVADVVAEFLRERYPNAEEAGLFGPIDDAHYIIANKLLDGRRSRA